MYVIHSESGKQLEATVSKIDPKEITLINKSKRFNFNWNKERSYEVYKLTVKGTEEPLGLISLEERSGDSAFEIRLLASSKDNIGEGKQFERIAGCLIAYACKKAFIAGYDGFVCLKPKSSLKDHYQQIYGMVSTKMYLITEGRNSLMLIEEYYENQENE
jgi:hypothetical protein